MLDSRCAPCESDDLLEIGTLTGDCPDCGCDLALTGQRRLSGREVLAVLRCGNDHRWLLRAFLVSMRNERD
ncbi:MAG: hypothetical protein KatS3mg014_2447 [Actinomycetota bacterium]|nr:MAG: hypothetical protein KatS3mg014_2447 [Actinomycetota bacterium]